MAEKLACKMFGHKCIKTADNKLYYVMTCTRCGFMQKYYHTKDNKTTNAIKPIKYN